MRITRWRLLLIPVIALPALLAAGYLFAASYTTLVFEAEDGKIQNGKSFHTAKYTQDPSGKVSQKKVMMIEKLPPGEKVKPDEVTYRVKIPADGTYYLWARTYWSTGCGNSFLIKIEGTGSGSAGWLLGGDGTYNALHWIPLSDGSDDSRLRPLALKKGVTEITLIAKESGAKADQFMLTTDRKKEPASIYEPTKDVLEKEDKDKDKKK